MINSLLLIVLLVTPKPTDKEVVWSAYLALQSGGVAEYRLPGGNRVDILTDDVAWEVEWCPKWTEAVGQSCYYAICTNRKPGIWLLKKGPEDDEVWNECLAVVQYLRGKGIDMQLKTTEVLSENP